VAVTIEEMGGWAAILHQLTAGQALTADQAGAALTDVLAGNATSAQIAGFIVALRMKGETVEEMSGLVRAMLAAAEPVVLSPDVQDRAVDVVGTGGDRSSTINVSTLAAFVVAGAGVPVVKHGNRAASSTTGAADVLEALGVRIDVGPGGIATCVEQAGMAFCFAPRFHSAMRHAGPVRRELGVPTVFNFLGPLANPAGVRRQVLGVSDPRMAERMIGVLAANGSVRSMVVHGDDGLDELTTTTTSTVIDHEAGRPLRTYTVDPAGLGLQPARPADLRGGTAAVNAGLARAVLAGERGPQRDIVLLNAAAGLVVAGVAHDLPDGLAQAERSIDSGGAVAVLEGLVKASNAVAG
jgi:anthranilate phosphoribosyltransferase